MMDLESRPARAAAELRRRAAREGVTVSAWLMSPGLYMLSAVARSDPAGNQLHLFGIPVEINHAPDAPDLIAKTALGELVGEPLGELVDSTIPASDESGR